MMSLPRRRARGDGLGNKSSLGRTFRTLEMCFTTLCVRAWSGHAELVYVQDCITCVVAGILKETEKERERAHGGKREQEREERKIEREISR